MKSNVKHNIKHHHKIKSCALSFVRSFKSSYAFIIIIFISYYHEGLASSVVRVWSVTAEEPSPCHDIIRCLFHFIVLFMHVHDHAL